MGMQDSLIKQLRPLPEMSPWIFQINTWPRSIFFKELHNSIFWMERRSFCKA